MKPDSDTLGPEAADAITAPLDLLLTDAAIGMLRRANPGGPGLRLAAALARRPGLVAEPGARAARRARARRRWHVAGPALAPRSPVRRSGVGG